MLKKEKGVEEKRLPLKESLVLVEFKAPRELMEDFDLKWRHRFSSRSEAIRFLLRGFVEGASKHTERTAVSISERV